MKHIKRFNENFFKNIFKKSKDSSLPVLTYGECEEKGYKVEDVPTFSGNAFAFTRKGIKVGDEVYYLGHDGVGGWQHGDTHIADQELVDKAEDLQFYKKVGIVLPHKNLKSYFNPISLK